MTPRKIAATLLALTMAFSGATFAQGRGHGDDRGGQGYDKHDKHDKHGKHDRRDDRGRQGPHARTMERGAGPNHEFRRGGRLPPQYRGRQYVVNDWRGHRLSAPPRGYHWVQNGGDYLLVAIATGVILQLLLNN